MIALLVLPMAAFMANARSPLSVSTSRALPPVCKEHRIPREIIFAPSKSLNAREHRLAEVLEAELSRSIDVFAKKQSKIITAEECMAAYVSALMALKAEELARWSELVLDNADSIPGDAATAIVSVDGTSVVLQFDREKYSSPREEALAEARMAAKLRKQQSKVDALRHQNGGTEAALEGWRKRVRVAAARGEAAAMEVLRCKLLNASKKLGLRRAVLASIDEREDLGI